MPMTAPLPPLPPLAPTTKGLVAVIETNPEHRRQVCDALGPLYQVAAFPHLDPAIPALARTRPQVILIDHAALPWGGTNPIAGLRDLVPGVRIIGTMRPAGSRLGGTANDLDAVLEKPYLRSSLLRAISDMINHAVEARWQALAPQYRESLQRTVDAFNSLSGMIEKGQPPDYAEMREACSPLVGAVQNHDFKVILDNVKGHDNYSYVHSMRVATLLSLFGHTLGLTTEDLTVLATGGLMHDIGKMCIPHEVLNKPGRLDESELKVMRSHVTRSVEYLAIQESLPRGVMLIAEQHHEKLNGCGYPHGLHGGQLNELARMAAIVDIFSALTDRRVYKAPMPPETALTLMTDQMGDEIDLTLLGLFKDMLLHAVAAEPT